MSRTLGNRRRAAAGVLALAGVMTGALVVPMPALPDDSRASVRTEVRHRLPGWRIERIDPSWEGAYTVVASCEDLEIGFQYVRGHGLPVDDAWIQPNDGYSRDRLARVSDHYRHLVWYSERRRPKNLSCRDELARLGEPAANARNFD